MTVPAIQQPGIPSPGGIYLRGQIKVAAVPYQQRCRFEGQWFCCCLHGNRYGKRYGIDVVVVVVAERMPPKEGEPRRLGLLKPLHSAPIPERLLGFGKNRIFIAFPLSLLSQVERESRERERIEREV